MASPSPRSPAASATRGRARRVRTLGAVLVPYVFVQPISSLAPWWHRLTAGDMIDPASAPCGRGPRGRRTVRRLGRAALFSGVRGLACAGGAAVGSLLVEWLAHR